MTRFVEVAALVAIGSLVACSSSTETGSLPPLPGMGGSADGGVAPAPTMTATPSDAGTSPPPTTACQPQTPTTAPTLWHPPATPRPACFQQEALALADCAFTGQNCNAPSQDCRSCAVTLKTTSPQYGPMIVDGQTGDVELNVEGCAALRSQDISATGCGPKLQAKYICQEQACAHCTNDEDVKKCSEAAATGACAASIAAAQPCEQYATQCFFGQPKEQVAIGLVMLFCGK